MKTNLLLVVAACVVGIGGGAAFAVEPIEVGPQDWAWWRGPTTDGMAPADQDPPVKWSADEGVLWKAQIPGRGHASPTVAGDHVYLPTADVERGTQSVLCFDRHTGERLWETVVHTGGLTTDGNKKASHASSSVACDGHRLFINFLNGGAVHTTALSRDGKELWTTKITDYVVHQGYGSSPALYKDLVIVSADNKGGGAIAGLQRDTGEIAWRVERPALPNYPSPVIVNAAGREQLIFTGCDVVASFDPMTGKKLWEKPGATTECVTTTVTHGGLIYTSGGYPKNHVAAMKADGSGEVAWSNTTRVYVPSMLVYRDHLFAVTDGGIAVCWDAQSGEERWKGRLGGGFSGSPVRVGDRIYATNEQAVTYVFAADPGKLELIAESRLGEETLSTPTICGGRVYLRAAHHEGGKRREMLYCVGR